MVIRLGLVPRVCSDPLFVLKGSSLIPYVGLGVLGFCELWGTSEGRRMGDLRVNNALLLMLSSSESDTGSGDSDIAAPAAGFFIIEKGREGRAPVGGGA